VIPRAVLLGLMALIALFGAVTMCARSVVRDQIAAVAALDPRSFDALTLVVVGSGGAYENPQRHGPAVAVGLGPRIVLVDAGRGVAEGLRAVTIPVAQPDTVFLTSLLPENVVGLDDLLYTGWLAPRTAPVRLIGPPGTRALAEALMRAHAGGVAALTESLALPADGALLSALEVGDGWSEDRDGLAVRVAALPGGPLPALAFRFEAKGRSAVVSGVGWGGDALVPFASGAGALVLEALHRPSLDGAIEAGGEDAERLRREGALHASLEDAASVASRAGVGTLVLVRLRPPPILAWQFERAAGAGFAGKVVVAADGEEIVP
jgi:ribonuclease Z